MHTFLVLYEIFLLIFEARKFASPSLKNPRHVTVTSIFSHCSLVIIVITVSYILHNFQFNTFCNYYF